MDDERPEASTPNAACSWAAPSATVSQSSQSHRSSLPVAALAKTHPRFTRPLSKTKQSLDQEEAELLSRLGAAYMYL